MRADCLTPLLTKLPERPATACLHDSKASPGKSWANLVRRRDQSAWPPLQLRIDASGMPSCMNYWHKARRLVLDAFK